MKKKKKPKQRKYKYLEHTAQTQAQAQAQAQKLHKMNHKLRGPQQQVTDNDNEKGQNQSLFIF